MNQPSHISAKHWQELQASAIDPEIASLNFRSIPEGHQAYGYLMYSNKLERRNDGRLATGILNRYRHIEQGGWWCNGLDPLNNWESMLWGCYKSDEPRRDVGTGKIIKYEVPLRSETRLFVLKVTRHVWRQVSKRFKVEHPVLENIPNEDLSRAFWEWVLAHPEISIIVTEGAKKAGCLLSVGYVAIALPGITSGYRVIREGIDGRVISRNLIPDLKPFLTKGRCFYICFDNDSRPSTIQAVRNATTQTGKLLSKEGCEVKIVTWSQYKEKGVDDLIVAHGVTAFDAAFNAAEQLETWQAKGLTELTYSPDVLVNQRYLGDLKIPDNAKIVGIKSPKGTNKTGSLSTFVEEALERGQWVLLLTHRIQLGRALCSRFPVPYIETILNPPDTSITKRKISDLKKQIEVLEQAINRGFSKQLNLLTEQEIEADPDIIRSELKHLKEQLQKEELLLKQQYNTSALHGFGLCVDSLHPLSQAKFNADNWVGGLIIIDECEQVLWHMLSASTEVQKHRIPVLKQFKKLIENAMNSEDGMVILSDADLSDVSIDYIKALSGADVKPYIILNTWKPNYDFWDVYVHGGSNPASLMKTLEEDIREGGKPLIFTSAQKTKSKYGTKNLENRLKKLFPNLKILRIDAESVADPKHPAYGCIAQINDVLQMYDCVIASPSLETGVSIDIRDHFTAVYGIFQGTLPENSVRQTLARLRDTVERHIWVATCGLGFVGNGSINPSDLLRSQDNLTKTHLRLLKDADIDFDLETDLDTSVDVPSQRCWANMGARINLGMIRYRRSVLAGLEAEGHRITQVSEAEGSKELDEVYSSHRDEQHQQEAHATTDKPIVPDSKYEELCNKKDKTEAERLTQRKNQLHRRYCVEITPDLVLRDDDGWYPQIRLNYYLTVGRKHLKARDRGKLESLRKSGNGAIWQPDFNSSQLGVKVGLLEALGIPSLLNPEREFKNTDEDLNKLATVAIAQRYHIRSGLGVSIADDDSPIEIFKRLLDKLCIKLKCTGRQGGRGDQVRVYKLFIPDDDRESIFTAWLQRDEALAAEREAKAALGAVNKVETDDFVSSSDTVVTRGKYIYIQSSDYHPSDYQSSDYQKRVDTTPNTTREAEAAPEIVEEAAPVAAVEVAPEVVATPLDDVSAGRKDLSPIFQVGQRFKRLTGVFKGQIFKALELAGNCVTLNDDWYATIEELSNAEAWEAIA